MNPAIMSKAAMASAIAALALAPSASALTFDLEQTRHLSPVQASAIERAVSFQVNRQVAKFWPGAHASFAPDGIPVYVTDQASTTFHCGAVDAACHTIAPAIYVSWTYLFDVQDSISHEVIETATDESESGHEICDPVEDQSYRGLSGVTLSNFVTPAFYSHQPGPKSFLSARRLARRKRSPR